MSSIKWKNHFTSILNFALRYTLLFRFNEFNIGRVPYISYIHKPGQGVRGQQ